MNFAAAEPLLFGVRRCDRNSALNNAWLATKRDPWRLFAWAASHGAVWTPEDLVMASRAAARAGHSNTVKEILATAGACDTARYPWGVFHAAALNCAADANQVEAVAQIASVPVVRRALQDIDVQREILHMILQHRRPDASKNIAVVKVLAPLLTNSVSAGIIAIWAMLRNIPEMLLAMLPYCGAAQHFMQAVLVTIAGTDLSDQRQCVKIVCDWGAPHLAVAYEMAKPQLDAVRLARLQTQLRGCGH